MKTRFLNTKNYCIDCKIEIVTLSAKRCNKCEGKRRRTLINKFCKDCGKQICCKSTGRCLKCANIYRRRIFPHKCMDCDNMVRTIKGQRCRTCANRLISKSYEHKPTHGKYTRYKFINFHSSWEANFAKWCDGSGIKWDYEPRAFDLLNNTAYWPDFYLPEFNCYIEIKGYWRKDAIKKFIIFKQYYSRIYIEIFDQEKLKEIGVL